MFERFVALVVSKGDSCVLLLLGLSVDPSVKKFPGIAPIESKVDISCTSGCSNLSSEGSCCMVLESSSLLAFMLELLATTARCSKTVFGKK